MRKLLVVVVGASLCAISYAQAPAESATPLSDAQPAERQSAPQQVSLGDYARQMRLKKQQREAQLQRASEAQDPAKEAQASAPQQPTGEAKPAEPTSAITPEVQKAEAPSVHPTPDIVEPQPKPVQIVTSAAVPARATVTPASVRETVSAAPQSQYRPTDAEIKEWKGEIQQQQTLVASMQQDINNLNNSIHFAGGNCIANCDQWNESQKKKQQEIDTLKTQLQQQQAILAEMLEAEKALTSGAGPSLQQASAH